MFAFTARTAPAAPLTTGTAAYKSNTMSETCGLCEIYNDPNAGTAAYAHPYLYGTIDARVCNPCVQRIRYTREAQRIISRGGKLKEGAPFGWGPNWPDPVTFRVLLQRDVRVGGPKP
eukprot:4179621-Prymnesium_polylepis.1